MALGFQAARKEMTVNKSNLSSHDQRIHQDPDPDPETNPPPPTEIIEKGA